MDLFLKSLNWPIIFRIRNILDTKSFSFIHKRKHNILQALLFPAVFGYVPVKKKTITNGSLCGMCMEVNLETTDSI